MKRYLKMNSVTANTMNAVNTANETGNGNAILISFWEFSLDWERWPKTKYCLLNESYITDPGGFVKSRGTPLFERFEVWFKTRAMVQKGGGAQTCLYRDPAISVADGASVAISPIDRYFWACQWCLVYPFSGVAYRGVLQLSGIGTVPSWGHASCNISHSGFNANHARDHGSRVHKRRGKYFYWSGRKPGISVSIPHTKVQ